MGPEVNLTALEYSKALSTGIQLGSYLGLPPFLTGVLVFRIARALGKDNQTMPKMVEGPLLMVTFFAGLLGSLEVARWIVGKAGWLPGNGMGPEAVDTLAITVNGTAMTFHMFMYIFAAIMGYVSGKALRVSKAPQ